MIRLLIALLLLTLSACATSKGFDRGMLRDSLSQPVTNQDIQAVLDLRPQLPKPFKLAVYVQGSEGYHHKPFWTEVEKSALLSYGDQLKQAGVVSDIALVSEGIVQTGPRSGMPSYVAQVKDLRLAAARYGADALLVVNGASSVDRYNNPSAFLYWTIIGAYFVPGTHSDALVMLKGALWDVRNEYLYATEEAEGMTQKTGPALVLDDTSSINQAKQVAIKEFGNNLASRLIRLNGKNP